MTQTLFSSLSISANAMGAYQRGIQVVSQNIANAQTPGYSRRVLHLSDRADLPIGGVDATVDRASDHFFYQQSVQQQTLNSYASTKNRYLSNLDGLLGRLDGSGIDARINDLFKSFSQLANNPSSATGTSIRAQVLQNIESVAAAFNKGAQDIQNTIQDLNNNVADLMNQIKTLSSQLAEANQLVLSNGRDGQEYLLDKRDMLAKELASLTGGSVLENNMGVNVYAFGCMLVDGSQQADISTKANINTGLLDIVNYQGQPVNHLVNGGKLGAVLDLRDNVVLGFQNKLDDMAYELTTRINTAHRAGYDLNGQNNRDLFSTTATSKGAAIALKISSDVKSKPDRIAAALDKTMLPGDNRNALAIVQLGQQKLFSSGRTTFAEEYVYFTNQISNQAQKAELDAQSAQNRHDMAQEKLESVTGVSIDEEMTNLVSFQQAYQASAKVMSVVSSMSESLIDMMR